MFPCRRSCGLPKHIRLKNTHLRVLSYLRAPRRCLPGLRRSHPKYVSALRFLRTPPLMSSPSLDEHFLFKVFSYQWTWEPLVPVTLMS